MRLAKGLAVLYVLLLSATSASAAGFRLPEAGAKAMGMGFAFTAQADDPSAIYFNPAGITQLPGKNVMAGMTYVDEKGANFTGVTPLTFLQDNGTVQHSETQKTLHFFIPNGYYTQQGPGSLTFGIGVFSPFGLGQEYQNRDTSIFRNQITKIELRTVVVNPTIAWKVNDVLSIGAGIDFMYGSAKLDQTAVLPSAAAGLPNLFKVHLDGDGTAWGYNAGILLTPGKTVKVGFNYRSPFTLDIKDAAVEIRDINGTPFFGGGTLSAQQIINGPGGGASFDTRAATRIEMPATAALGISYTRDRLTLEADIDWTFWHNFQTLVIDFKDNRPPLLNDAVRPENWRDVAAYRIGGQYRVTDPLAVRLGFYYDETPVPAATMSPLLPDANRLSYTAGLGYTLKNLTIDASYLFIKKRDRTVNNLNVAAQSGFNGTWKGEAHVVALDLGYRF